ncbi:MAG: alpha/beta hydrolase [Verrucomicrobiae bacterium]|nr:alpha/beta hydrolase [Verrucomicrobiae bacterium]
MKKAIPVAALFVVSTCVFAERPRLLRLLTPDDVGLAAAYYRATTTNAVAPAAVLLHSYGESRDEWGAFPLLLQHNGIHVLNFDLRGHGESTRRITADGPQPLEHQSFTSRDFQNLLVDVNTAGSWRKGQPGGDRERIGLLGSSLGANLALRYAVEHEKLAALLLLSPGYEYKQIRADDVFPRLPRIPLRVVVSLRDTFAFEFSRRMLDERYQSGRARDFKELIVCSGALHGTELLRLVRDLQPTLIRWLRHVLYGEFLEEPAQLEPPPPALTNVPHPQPKRPTRSTRKLP